MSIALATKGKICVGRVIQANPFTPILDCYVALILDKPHGLQVVDDAPMGIKVTWSPNQESDVAEYEIWKAPDNVNFTLLTTVIHDEDDPLVYDPVNQVFYYNDLVGLTTDWYKIRAKDGAGNLSGFTLSKQAGPVLPAMCTVYGNVKDTDGNPNTDVQVQVRIKRTNKTKEGQFVATDGVTSDFVETFTDDAGFWEIDVIQLATVDVIIPKINLYVEVEVPAAASAEITTLI